MFFTYAIKVLDCTKTWEVRKSKNLNLKTNKENTKQKQMKKTKNTKQKEN